MGAATSWRLTERGADVVCFDRYSPPHANGSSHGESRIIRTAYFEGAYYVPLLREAFALWRELERLSGTRIVTMTGALMIGSASSEIVKGTLEAATRHRLDVDRMEPAEFRRRYPGHVVRDDDVGVLDREGGFLSPENAVTAMLARTGTVKRDVRIESLEPLLKEFDRVVVAAGPWAPEFFAWLPVQIERQVHVWFAIAREAEAGGWFAPERFPVFIRQSTDFGDVYGIPSLDGASVKVGRHHQGAFTDPDHIRRRVDETDVDPLRLMTATYLKGVSGHALRSLTCMYTNTPDHDFVIDFSPRDPRVVVLSPCSGHGFKFAPVIGDIAADLVCDGGTARDISRFSASRFAPAHVPHDKPDGDQ
jgi:sarcosine oxidase